ncbi:MAG: ParB N-terminal domain-containing protein [Euryarchaeota archaeon]|nr:ParB N-terminal domain-containing protein [Euryarchaeota archaeon]
MNIKTIDINRLNPAKYNPRKDLKPGDQDYESLKHSVEHWGLVDPLIVNENMTVVGGHQRLKVVRDLGYDKVECVMVDLDEANERALNIALNKISGEWDLELLKSELTILSDMDFNIDLTGFDNIEIEDMLADESQHHNGTCNDVVFVDDDEKALTFDENDAKYFEGKSIIAVAFSGGKDSCFALYWAKHNFPDKRIVAIFSDTGVEFPGMAAHVKSCCDFLGVEFVIVKPKKDMLVEIEKRGWPNILFAWCQQEFIHKPVEDYQLTLPPIDTIILDGSSASQATDQSKKTKTSKALDKRMSEYDYYHPAFDISRDTLESVLKKSGMPEWVGYSKGFVRTSCWMCIGMNSMQAAALNDNYPGLVRHIRDMELKLGKKLKELQNRSIDDLIASGEKKRKKRS